jgi:DNA mismatch repair protein MutS2
MEASDEAVRKAAHDLEWAELCAALAGRCRNEVAVERLRTLVPAPTLEEARARMALTGEALAALALAEAVPAVDVPAIADTLEHVVRGGVARGDELAQVKRVLVSARILRAYARERQAAQPLLSATLDSAATLDELDRSLGRALDEKGRIVDDASPELSAARTNERRARRSLTDKLAAMMTSHADVLREGSWVERDGRYGLPVRSDAHRRVEGIVLGSSGSGATLFIEPPEVTSIVNRLKMAEADVERAEERVLVELCASLARQHAEVEAAYEACLQADVLGALSSWAEKARAVAIMPDEERRLVLESMRHPLLVLQGGKVVPTDVELEGGSALVISGPNAGGKTVALKCLGLAVWMARAGVPLPLSEGSRIGWFDAVLTDIGDEQSVSRSLSTFSAEIENVSRILARSGDRTLVLLDEVAGGTDPEEGAALASALLEALTARGAAVAVTTHYERLKELAAERFVNASVGFDFDAMQPTFTLTMGVPGASSALHVAKRFGMPPQVVERARALLSDASVNREELIAKLERERRVLSAARESATRDAEEAEVLRQEMEAARREVRQKEKARLAGQAADLAAAVRKARADLRKLESELAEVQSREALRSVERRVDEAGRLASVAGPIASAARALDERAPLNPAELRVGMPVYVERLGVVAEIEELPERGQVRVRAGALALRVAVEELRRAPATKVKRAPVQAPVAQRQAPAPSEIGRSIRTMANTCDLRGQRVDEALEQLDRFIDALSLSSESVGFVLHGHGTGALKQAVREHLALSSRIDAHRAAITDEGGDAFTVFRIRQ